MKNKILVFLILYSTLFYGQYDTITYKDVKVIVNANKKDIYFKDKLFNGYIKYEKEDGASCFEFIRNGKSVKLKCEGSKKTLDRLQAYKAELNKFSVNKSIDIKDLSKVSMPIESDSCLECGNRTFDIYSYKNEKYSGYVKFNDSIFFLYHGEIKFKKSFYKNKSIEEYTEYHQGIKYGKYTKYKDDSSILTEGSFLNGEKSGEWKIYNSGDYDLIQENYIKGSKEGVWFFYKKKDLVRCEFYKDDELDYYYVSEFYKNTETRKFYRSGKNYAIVKYVDGHIDKYIDIE